jgi:hypothetical protein
MLSIVILIDRNPGNWFMDGRELEPGGHIKSFTPHDWPKIPLDKAPSSVYDVIMFII